MAQANDYLFFFPSDQIFVRRKWKRGLIITNKNCKQLLLLWCFDQAGIWCLRSQELILKVDLYYQSHTQRPN